MWDQYVHQTAKPVNESLWIREFKEELQSIVTARSNSTHSALEIGVGSGRFLDWFKQEFGYSKLSGIDLSIASSVYVNNFVVADGIVPPFSSAFDLVFSIGLIEHFSTFESRFELVRGHWAACRSGGLIIIGWPVTQFSVMGLRRRYWSDVIQQNFGFHQSVDYKEIATHFQTLNIEPLCIRHLGWWLDSPKLPAFLRQKLWEHYFTCTRVVVVGCKN